MQTGRRRLAGGGDQVGALAVVPGERVIDAGEGERRRVGAGGVEHDVVAVRRDRGGGGVGGAHVPGEQAGDRGVPLGREQVVGGPFGGVDPEQVVEPVSVRGHRFQQMRVDQHLEGVFGRVFRDAEQGRRGGGRDRGALPQAEQAEREGRVDALLVGAGGQAGEAHLEAGPDGEVPGAHLVQPAVLVGEPPGHRPDGPAAAGDQPGRADPDGQGQAGAGVEQLGGGLGFGRGPLLTHHLDEQLQRLVVVEHVQVDQLGAGQVGHPAPRRDQYRGRRGARQQRPDLGRVARVVQHHQHPAAGQRGPVPGRALVFVHRDVPAVHPEIAQEPGQHVTGQERGRGRAEQVDVQLAIGEPAADPVRGVHGQRGLAQAARAGHHGDADRAGIAGRARSRQQVTQPLDLLVAAGEVGDIGRQLRWARGRALGAAGRARLGSGFCGRVQNTRL